MQANAWRVPLWGRPADQDLPQWLVDRLSSGEVFINHLGGLSTQSAGGQIGCLPGDWIQLAGSGDIEFCQADEFNQQVNYSLPAKAA